MNQQEGVEKGICVVVLYIEREQRTQTMVGLTSVLWRLTCYYLIRLEFFKSNIIIKV